MTMKDIKVSKILSYNLKYQRKKCIFKIGENFTRTKRLFSSSAEDSGDIVVELSMEVVIFKCVN